MGRNFDILPVATFVEDSWISLYPVGPTAVILSDTQLVNAASTVN